MTSYPYWQYFLAIEADFAATTRYVEICSDNYKTYSVEYAKLLLASASEIDVVCKILCKKLDTTANPGNMDDYRNCIVRHTALSDEKVLVRRYNIELEPWKTWKGTCNPPWWSNYNKVKHQRNQYYTEANLKNCINSVAALFILVIYLHKAERSNARLEPRPELLGRESEPGFMLLEDGYTVPDFR
ncbi:MAG: hypothetical protein ACK4V0_04715 [Aphanizomenon sp.]|jgi:hypothetical protein